MSVDEATEAQIQELASRLQSVVEMMGKRLVGQQHVARRLLMGLMTQGHVLLEGLPGLAKTTAVKALSDTSDLSVRRIQFTPDLLPADVLGTQIYDPRSGGFLIKKGPIFANLVIADEINRAPAKVQSALLEAMQEGQVTIGDETFVLDQPFLVMATQNPIEQEGTYPLPEAQVDRFLFKVKVSYGSFDEEKEIVSRMASGREIPLERMIGKDDLILSRELLNQIYVADKIRHYIVELVCASREPQKFGVRGMEGLIQVGASPRASINLEKAARAAALMDGRSFVSPDDIKDIALDIMRHRLIPTYEAEAENISQDDLVQMLLEQVNVP
ncbi:MAG: AAA family ATPase [Oligoflexus sp.]